MRSRRLAARSLSLALTAMVGACAMQTDAPGTEHLGERKFAVTSVSPSVDWSQFPSNQQCVGGVDGFLQAKFGTSFKALCTNANVGNCADCGACKLWVDPAVAPDPNVWTKYTWGQTSPQAYDIAVFPPVYSAYGHVAAVDRMENGQLFVMDDNWNDDMAKASCTFGDHVCGHPHGIGSYTPYGFYRLKSLDHPTLDAKFVGQNSDAMADPTGQAYFQVCTGQTFHFSFELEDVGTASWVDWGAMGTSWGQDVRLGVPGDTPDVFTGTTRISVNENVNNDVHPATWNPPGGDCNDQPHCRRTVFTNGGIVAKAPATPGIYKTTWQLVDEGRAWFGPQMWLSYSVVDCTPEVDAELVGFTTDASPDPAKKADYQLCAGEAFHFSVELRNTGKATWTDTDGTDPGTSIRLGVPMNAIDPFTGTDRVSLNENANAKVDPKGGDCDDAAGCARTRFTKSGIAGKAPAKPGTYTSTWQLVDEKRTWFGPTIAKTYSVVACAGGSGGAAGHGGAAGGTGGGAAGKDAGGATAGGAGGAAGEGGASSGIVLPAEDGGDAGESGGCAIRRSEGAYGWLFVALAGMVARRRRSR